MSLYLFSSLVPFHAIPSRKSRKSHEARIVTLACVGISRVFIPNGKHEHASAFRVIPMFHIACFRVFREIRVKLSFCVREILYISHHKGTPIS